MDQAEKLRNLIKGREPAKMNKARILTVTSGKGGVGKSSVTINLAIQLSRLGKRVVILDTDFGLANIEIMLGLRPTYNFGDLMFHGKTLSDIVTLGPENVGFVSGGSGIHELANLSKDSILNIVRKLYELDEIADIVLIDTGAGISDSVMEFVASSLEVILVVTPEPTSITDAYALLKTLNRNSVFNKEKASIRVIGNKVRNNKEEGGRELFDKLSAVVDKFLNIELELLGTVPYDDCCQKAIMKQRPFALEYPNSASSRALQDISLLLVDANMDVPMSQKGIGKLFANLIRNKFRNK